MQPAADCATNFKSSTCLVQSNISSISLVAHRAGSQGHWTAAVVRARTRRVITLSVRANNDTPPTTSQLLAQVLRLLEQSSQVHPFFLKKHFPRKHPRGSRLVGMCSSRAVSIEPTRCKVKSANTPPSLLPKKKKREKIFLKREDKKRQNYNKFYKQISKRSTVNCNQKEVKSKKIQQFKK